MIVCAACVESSTKGFCRPNGPYRPHGPRSSCLATESMSGDSSGSVSAAPRADQIPAAIAVAAAIESIAVIQPQTQVRMRSIEVVPSCIVTVALPRLEMVRRPDPTEEYHSS